MIAAPEANQPDCPGENPQVTSLDNTRRTALLRRGFALEYATLGWNVIGIVVLAVAAWSARSVALAGFGFDSLIEIGASILVFYAVHETREIFFGSH